MTQKYLEALNAVIDDPDSTVDEKANAFGEMDKVIRISKLSSDRVLLAEGKTTENVGLNSSAEIPFTVIFTKTYEIQKSEVGSQESEKNDESTDDTD